MHDAVKNEIERAVIRHYPEQALATPKSYEYDSTYATLKQVLADLRKIDPGLTPGTRTRPELSEEWILIGTLRLQLSIVGPFAALNYGVEHDLDEDERELAERIRGVLDEHGIALLEPVDLDERVPWIRRGQAANVWNCLFAFPDD